MLSVLAAIWSLPGALARAAEDPARAARMGAHLRVELLTMGPGTEAYSRFGHSALRITDLRGVGDIVFNFGTFDHEDPKVVSKFLAGKLRFWLSVSTYAETVKEYSAEKRRLTAQELRLTPLQRRRLFNRLYWMSKPDRRNYPYHHFQRNCSTRIRDVLDEIMVSALRQQLTRRPAHTYRHWLRRATRGAPLFHLGFDLVVTRVDGRISAWQACFAPEQLSRAMAAARVQRNGRSVPFVAKTRVLLPGPDFETDAGTAPWTVVMLLGWLLLALAVVPTTVRPRSAWAWRLAGGVLVVWGLITTALSALLLYIQSISSLSVFTGNQNVVLLPPTQLLWVILGVLLAVRPPPRWCPARWLLALVAFHALVVLGYTGLLALGRAGQGNGALVAVVLPWTLAGLWILFRARLSVDRD